MRVCKNNIHYRDYRFEQLKDEPGMFICTHCKYVSKRYFNMERHKDRIHRPQILRNCCGITFNTKGDYYIHCEEWHPETRPNSITSKTKYKIVSDMVPMHRRNDPDFRAYVRNVNSEKANNPYNMRPRLKSLNEMIKEQTKTKVSVEYSVRCNDFNIKATSTISFLAEQQFKSCLGQLVPLNLAEEKSNETKEKETNQTVKIAISSEQNIEKTVSANAEKIRTKVSDSGVSSFSVELPAKKLLLHRFRSDVHQYEALLREKNDGDFKTENSVDGSGQRNILNIQQKRFEYSKYDGYVTHRGDKENVSKFISEQQLNVDVGRKIEVPMVTQMHQNFLGSIEFKNYKIF